MKIIRLKTFFVAALILLYAACNNKKVQQHAKGETIKMEAIVSENLKEDFKTSNIKTIEDVSYKLYHISEGSLKEIFKENTNEYGNFTCFYFDIELAKESDIVNYPSINYLNLNDKIQYLSFMIKNYLQVEANGNKYYCVNSTYDRTYGKSKSARFFLVFNKIKEKNITFQYNDDYFNNGAIQLKLTI